MSMKFFAVTLLIIVLSACSDSSSKVEGRWKLENIDYSAYFSEVSDEVRSFLEGQMEVEFNRLKDKTFFEFGENNVLKLEAPNYVDKKTITDGTWKMNAAQDSIFFQLADPESYKIITLNEKEMILSTDETPKRTLVLSKVN